MFPWTRYACREVRIVSGAWIAMNDAAVCAFRAPLRSPAHAVTERRQSFLSGLASRRDQDHQDSCWTFLTSQDKTAAALRTGTPFRIAPILTCI